MQASSSEVLCLIDRIQRLLAGIDCGYRSLEAVLTLLSFRLLDSELRALNIRRFVQKWQGQSSTSTAGCKELRTILSRSWSGR